MAKRKSSAPSNSNSNSKRNKTDDSETSEMLRRAMDMQAEFDQEDSGSESSDNDSEEQDATDSEDSQHQEHSETEPAVLPLPGTSKSAASRVCPAKPSDRAQSKLICINSSKASSEKPGLCIHLLPVQLSSKCSKHFVT